MLITALLPTLTAVAAQSHIYTGSLWWPGAAGVPASHTVAHSAPVAEPTAGQARAYCNSTLVPLSNTQMLHCNSDLGPAPFGPDCKANDNFEGGKTYACPIAPVGLRCAEHYRPAEHRYNATCDWPSLQKNPKCTETRDGELYKYDCPWSPTW